ncbi:hypothetical protein C8Z91_11395 [Paenibacillus elgii]|uniref:Uncharacterized protein n=1 Tax=Paenibacillus elgii TaxID=189691 RepID=A0A2T6G4H5_9BACL|nr:hypothetical protein [Paenibacillus elgii]PUA39069.1 hypothetical protein C8Z91_11395 [Paenibacillus elgii]
MNNTYPTSYGSPVIVNFPTQDAARNGEFFFTTTGTQTVANGNFLSFQISNNSKQQIYINSITVTFITQGKKQDDQFSEFDFFKNPTTFTVAGTAETIWNANFKLPDGIAGITAKYDPVNNQFAGLSPFATYNQNVGVTMINLSGSIIIPPGNSLGMRLNNSSTTATSAVQASFNVNFWAGV